MKKKSQLFKCDPSLNICIDYFKKHLEFDSTTKTYISNLSGFKKMNMFHHLHAFKEYITPFYFDSKKIYPLNMLSYKGFNVVLRQLCKNFGIVYTYKIKYIHSNYEIIYSVVLPETD